MSDPKDAWIYALQTDQLKDELEDRQLSTEGTVPELRHCSIRFTHFQREATGNDRPGNVQDYDSHIHVTDLQDAAVSREQYHDQGIEIVIAVSFMYSFNILGLGVSSVGASGSLSLPPRGTLIPTQTAHSTGIHVTYIVSTEGNPSPIESPTNPTGSRAAVSLPNHTGTVPRTDSSCATYVSSRLLKENYPSSRPFSRALSMSDATYSCLPPHLTDRYRYAGLVTGQSDRSNPNNGYRVSANYSLSENDHWFTANIISKTGNPSFTMPDCPRCEENASGSRYT